jgi:hypothetical protein
MEYCLMNLNKGEDDFGGGNILQYSEWNDMVEGINTEELNGLQLTSNSKPLSYADCVRCTYQA